MSSNLGLTALTVLITGIAISSSPTSAIASSMMGTTIHRKTVVCPAQPAAARAKNAAVQSVLGTIGNADTILNAIELELWWADKRGLNKVYLTKGEQLVGSHGALLAFRKAHSKLYSNWDSHHIVEEVHLRNLGRRYSSRNDLPAVLIPKVAHSKRINSILRSADCQILTAKDLYSYYADAYELLGAYTGKATESQIQAELLAIVRTLLGL